MKAITRIFAAIAVVGAVQAFAQGYPNKPVHAIISFTPGSSTDIVGRIVLDPLSQRLGQPIVVDLRQPVDGVVRAAVVDDDQLHGTRVTDVQHLADCPHDGRFRVADWHQDRQSQRADRIEHALERLAIQRRDGQ